MQGAEGAQEPKRAGGLWNLLADRREEILSRWLTHVRRDILPGNLPEPALLDHVPEFLDQLTDALRRGAPADESVVGQIGEQHGRQRFSHGANTDAVVREYGALHRVILEALAERPIPMTLDEHRVLVEALIGATREAVHTLSEAREQVLRARGQRLRRIAESGIVGLIEWDARTRQLTDANDAFLDMLGYGRHELVAGQLSLRSLTPPEHEQATERALRVLHERGALAPFEKQYFHRDGHRVDVELTAATLESEEERQHVIALVLDVSRRKESERERERLLLEMREAVRVREELMGVVSHDLRNPLNAISLSAELLRARQDLDPHAARLVQRINDSCQRALRLIGDLLDAAQARARGLYVEPQRVDTAELVRAAVDEVRAGHPERDLELAVSGATTSELDPARTLQLLSNLLENALSHSPPGSPVQVAVRGEDDHVTVEVHNDGDPIPPELLASLFQPFRRGRGRGREQSDGVGLGLYIADQIAQAHGGEIDARSTPDEGTTFTVNLPRSN